MVIISPDTRHMPAPELELAGRVGERGPEVNCSVVLADRADPTEAQTLELVAGYGGRAQHYYPLQTHLARLGVNSICVDPVYAPTREQNRQQAKASEVGHDYIRKEYGIAPENFYGHSWGGQKLASWLRHGIPGAKLAIFHATSGIEDPIKNMVTHPWDAIRQGFHEMKGVFRPVAEQTDEEGLEHDLLFPSLKPGEFFAFLQQGFTAAHHRKLVEHLGKVKARQEGVTTVGLWPEHDLLFRLKEHKIFDYNQSLPKSVHTEPQANAKRMAKELAEVIELRPKLEEAKAVGAALPEKFAA
ncbi:MAG: hypothetical protein JWO47_1063 [Candidatus Saccharibacteria bacterium]|nr:hypothetical protein [Candidatus Saccharibacteria bacterium]